MLVQARLGQRQEASQLAEEVRAYAPQHPGKLFSAACAYALCLPGLTDKEDSERQYAQRAFETLRQAVEHGYRDVKAVESAPDLAPLRSKPGYRELLAALTRRPG
jgi:hypothetical protein